MKKKSSKKRQFLGTGYIWFSNDSWPLGYHAVRLTTEPNGRGTMIKIRTGRLGGWQKVRLIAEYTPVKDK